MRGLITALEDDPRLQYALEISPDIAFSTYQVSFKLNRPDGHLL